MSLPRAILLDLDDTIISAYRRPLIAWNKVAREFAAQLAPLDPADAAALIAVGARTFWDDPARARHWRQQVLPARIFKQLLKIALGDPDARGDRLAQRVRGRRCRSGDRSGIRTKHADTASI